MYETKKYIDTTLEYDIIDSIGDMHYIIEVHSSGDANHIVRELPWSISAYANLVFARRGNKVVVGKSIHSSVGTYTSCDFQEVYDKHVKSNKRIRKEQDAIRAKH